MTIVALVKLTTRLSSVDSRPTRRIARGCQRQRTSPVAYEGYTGRIPEVAALSFPGTVSKIYLARVPAYSCVSPGIISA